MQLESKTEEEYDLGNQDRGENGGQRGDTL